MKFISSASSATWVTFTCSASNWATNMAKSTVIEKGWEDPELKGVCHMRKWRNNKGKAIHVLSIDFDYWYLGDNDPDAHCGFCDCQVTDEWDPGLERCRPTPLTKGKRPVRTINYPMIFRRIAEGTPIQVTECHAAITGPLMKLREDNPDAHICVWNIDEHEDVWGYYSVPERPHCGGWVDYSGEKGWLDEYWWVTDKQHLWQMPTNPDMVFVCKSSPYTDVSGDRPLITFIRNLEKASGQDARVFGHASRPIQEALTERRAVCHRAHM